MKQPYSKGSNRQVNYNSRSSNRVQYHYLGTEVYFHATSRSISHSKECKFFCKGVVARKPLRNSQVYKVIVTEVCPLSVEGERNSFLARKLLGKRLPKGPEEVTNKPTSVYTSMYAEWIELTSIERQRVDKKINDEIDKIRSKSRSQQR